MKKFAQTRELRTHRLMKCALLFKTQLLAIASEKSAS